MNHRWIGALVGIFTGSLLVSDALATSSCSFSSTVGVAFGSYNVFSSAALDSAGGFTYTCQNVGVSDTILIELSRGSASSFFPRQMLGTGGTLGYNLYLDAARMSVWGDTTGGTSAYGPTTPPSGSPVTVQVYGRVPALQNVAVGGYSDTIVVTILF
jgi:spore coat protein U-like protein